jgi:hypothetical protein
MTSFGLGLKRYNQKNRLVSPPLQKPITPVAPPRQGINPPTVPQSIQSTIPAVQPQQQTTIQTTQPQTATTANPQAAAIKKAIELKRQIGI